MKDKTTYQVNRDSKTSGGAALGISIPTTRGIAREIVLATVARPAQTELKNSLTYGDAPAGLPVRAR